MSVAVVGSGCAGLAAAHALSKAGLHVTVFEAASHVGGHAHTVQVEGTAVDVGFMVCNRVTYPNMVRGTNAQRQQRWRLTRALDSQLAWFEELGVAVEPSDMSFSVSRREGSEARPGPRISHAASQPPPARRARSAPAACSHASAVLRTTTLARWSGEATA